MSRLLTNICAALILLSGVLMVSVIASCDQKCAPKPKGSLNFYVGEFAIHKKSNEKVRVIGKWITTGGRKRCRYKINIYDIRFSDGSEVQVNGNTLKRNKSKK